MKSEKHREKMRLRRESQRNCIAHAGGFFVKDEGKRRFISVEERAMQIKGFADGIREENRRHGVGRPIEREAPVGGQTLAPGTVLNSEAGEADAS